MIGYALLEAILLLRSWRWIAEQPFGAAYWAFTFGATALAGAASKQPPLNSTKCIPNAGN